jgi:hypothetical protein
MQSTDREATSLVHRLLFRALIEIREQGNEQNNKIVFHLADLFHTTILEMESAAVDGSSYEEVLRHLEEKAKEKDCDRWLRSAIAEVEIGRSTNSNN